VVEVVEIIHRQLIIELVFMVEDMVLVGRQAQLVLDRSLEAPQVLVVVHLEAREVQQEIIIEEVDLKQEDLPQEEKVEMVANTVDGFQPQEFLDMRQEVVQEILLEMVQLVEAVVDMLAVVVVAAMRPEGLVVVVMDMQILPILFLEHLINKLDHMHPHFIPLVHMEGQQVAAQLFS
jgi:hypothetical protein